MRNNRPPLFWHSTKKNTRICYINFKVINRKTTDFALENDLKCYNLLLNGKMLPDLTHTAAAWSPQRPWTTWDVGNTEHSSGFANISPENRQTIFPARDREWPWLRPCASSWAASRRHGCRMTFASAQPERKWQIYVYLCWWSSVTKMTRARFSQARYFLANVK